ncbi:MAG: DNA repair protein RadC [Treponema sp.]|jgi:DNA repair protein RadC|nr:DNA repair protein RadC [Treponema sp.]
MDDFDYPDCFTEARSRYTGKGAGPGPLELPPERRPRERLLANGPAALSDLELLAIILNTGTRGKNVSLLAGDLLGLLDRNKDIPPVEELSRLVGLGKTKASLIAAMLEFGRRRWGSVGTRVKQPLDIFTLVRHNADRKQERFISISLNGAHEALAVRVVTIGLLNRTIVHPREVFADLIQDRAAAFAVAHNHPSGKILPSSEDDEITERLRAASEILGLHFLDHLIFSESNWWSYRQNGRIGEKTRGAEQRPVLRAAPVT